MQAGVWGAFVAVLAMGPMVAGSLEPGTDGPAAPIDGALWELRLRGITPDEPDPWVNEAGDRMVGDLTFLDDQDDVTASIEAQTGDAEVGDLRAASATLAGDLACPACVDEADVAFAYARSASKGGAASDAELLDGLDSAQFVRSDRGGHIAGDVEIAGDLGVDGNLDVGGSVNFHGQKLCIGALFNESIRPMHLLVPQGWTAQKCAHFMGNMAGFAVWLGCVFETDWSESRYPTPPTPNCGW